MKIWEEALTEYDIKIRKKLVEIRKLLNENKNNIHIHWFREKSIQKLDLSNNLSSDEMLDELLKNRAKEIYAWLVSNGFDDDREFDLECFTVEWYKNLLLKINEKSGGENAFKKLIPENFTINSYNLFKLRAGFINHFLDEKAFSKSLKYQELAKLFGINLEIDDDEEKNLKGHVSETFNYLFTDIEDLAAKLAKDEFVRFVLYEYKGFRLNQEEALKIFHYEFFRPPVKYFPGKISSNIILGIGNFFNDIFSGGLPDSYHNIRNQYEESSINFILNGQVLFSYHLAFLILGDNIKYRYGDLDILKTIFNLEEIDDAKEEIVEVIQSMIQVRIEIFYNHFEDFLISILKKSQNSKIFPNQKSLIEYLLKYYDNIMSDEGRKIVLFKGLKFPVSLNRSIIEIIILLLKMKLDEINGILYEKLLLPKEFEAILDKENKEKAKEISSKYPKVDYPFFVNKKLGWHESRREELEKAFSHLYRRRNKDGIHFMKEEEVIYLLRANFSCYEDYPFEPKMFVFNGAPGTFNFFMYQIYKTLGGQDYTGNTKKRLGQFLAQNIALYYREELTPGQSNSFGQNIKDIKPQENEVIAFNEKGEWLEI